MQQWRPAGGRSPQELPLNSVEKHKSLNVLYMQTLRRVWVSVIRAEKEKSSSPFQEATVETKYTCVTEAVIGDDRDPFPSTFFFHNSYPQDPS